MENKEGQIKKKGQWLKDVDKITVTPERETRTEFTYNELWLRLFFLFGESHKSRLFSETLEEISDKWVFGRAETFCYRLRIFLVFYLTENSS